MQTAPNPLPALSESDKARFWAKVNKDGPLPDQSNPHYVGLGQCWVWTAGVDNFGYGRFQLNGRPNQAHRISFGIAYEITAEKPFVLHRCDNPSCVNPSHLWAGTKLENARDRESKNRNKIDFAQRAIMSQPELRPRGDRNGARLHPERIARGENVRTAKLSADQVSEIRSLRATGEYSLPKLARMFQVGTSQIFRIVQGKGWSHIS